MKVEFLPIKTRIVHPPKDEIWDIIDSLEVRDGDIVFITSKVMGIHQGRTRKIGEVEKLKLIQEEAERYLRYDNEVNGFGVNLTVTQNVLIPAAGIDESNADGYYVMWPEEMDAFCREIRMRLMKKFGLKRLGVVSTDSHTMPLRWGVTGITIGLAGVEPTMDIRGEKDLFGREMLVTKVDMIDPLASMAVNVMGESRECTPIVIARGDLNIEFSDDGSMEGFKISPEMDLYRPLIEVIPPSTDSPLFVD